LSREIIKIAAFGPTTACAVESEGLRLDINAPNPKLHQ